MDEYGKLRLKALQIRQDLLDMIYEAKTGHTGGSLSSTDILVSLFYRIMDFDPSNPKDENRDRFILSKGHSVEAYYCVLADRGFFPKEELHTFSACGSRLTGHPNVKVPGVEMCTGALGHGLPVGVGMALAGKMDGRSYRVYVLMGDGEQAEGSVWEAAMAAANYGLDNLIGIVDRNGLQISGKTEEVMKLESLAGKWRAFGWEVIETDGHDIKKLVETFRGIPAQAGKPYLIIANTVKGKGVSYMENAAKWHHGVPDAEAFRLAQEELNACRRRIEFE
jgi:transketolase